MERSQRFVTFVCIACSFVCKTKWHKNKIKSCKISKNTDIKSYKLHFKNIFILPYLHTRVEYTGVIPRPSTKNQALHSKNKKYRHVCKLIFLYFFHYNLFFFSSTPQKQSKAKQREALEVFWCAPAGKKSDNPKKTKNGKRTRQEKEIFF